MIMANLFGGIEAGGTKFVCAVGSGPQDLVAETRFPTTTPDETMHRVIEFFKTKINDLGPLAALGVASFGPLDPKLDSPTYGYITSTPKPGWANFDFVGSLKRAFDLPVGFDTDVDGAVLGEWRWGNGKGLDSLVYLTIGTGIGGGAMANGAVIHGLLHTEMGHLRIPHDLHHDPFPGICPYHGDCWEGLACGPAIEKRWGKKAESLPVDHPAWRLEADYLASALMNLILVLSPQRIIMGGGVMSQAALFPLVRQRVLERLNHYIKSSQIVEKIEQYIVPPGLGAKSGVLGAIALAELARNL
jgi:fructokinase